MGGWVNQIILAQDDPTRLDVSILLLFIVLKYTSVVTINSSVCCPFTTTRLCYCRTALQRTRMYVGLLPISKLFVPEAGAHL